MRQQNVNQGLSFPPLLSESCQGCHSTLMSIFSTTSTPTLSLHSAWWISSLSAPLSPLSFSFSSLAPARSLSFMAYSCAATPALSEGWLVGGGGGGGGGGMVGLHVLKQTEIFMQVCLCRCVRATSRVPLLGLCTLICVCSMKWAAAHKDICMLICVL